MISENANLINLECFKPGSCQYKKVIGLIDDLADVQVGLEVCYGEAQVAIRKP